MKKRLIFIVLSVLLLVASFTLAACKPDPQPPIDPNTPGDSDTPVDPNTPVEPSPADNILLIHDGVSEYRIVISDFANDEEKAAATDFRRKVEAVTGAKLPVVTDWEDKNDNEDIKEILIGRTNRAATSVLAEELGADEFGFAVIGNKIVLGGNSLIQNAIQLFLSEYLGYSGEQQAPSLTTVTLPKELKVMKSIYDSQRVVLYVANERLGYVDTLQAELQKQYADLEVVTHQTDLSDIFAFPASRLVIVAGIDTMPMAAQPAIDSYLRQGGRVLMLGGPAFETNLYELDGEWYEKDQYNVALYDSIDQDQQEILLDPRNLSTRGGYTSSSDNSTAFTVRVEDFGLRGSPRQLFHEVENYSNWAILNIASSVSLKNANMITFYAKPGDDHTDNFAFEITESNGARWYTEISFSGEDWAHYVLIPSDFTWFKSGPAAKGSYPDFTDIAGLRIGFANHAAHVTPGHHSYYLSEIKVASVDAEKLDQGNMTALKLDGVAPMYEQYPVTNAAHVFAAENQIFVSERDYVVPEGLISRHPGISGVGYNNDFPIRFIPLLRVTDEKGLHSGYAAWIDLYAHSSKRNGSLEGSMVGYFSPTTEDFYNADGIAAVMETVAAMTSNYFIVNAGTDAYTYLAPKTDEITAGVTYVTLPGKVSSAPVAKVALYSGDRLLREYSSEEIPPANLKSTVQALQGVFALEGIQPDRAVATLSVDGKVIDRMEQEIHFWSPKPEEERSYIYVEDGYFKRDGKIINFFGANFMASYRAAMTAGTPSGHTYDPAVVYRDLLRLKDLGMNAVALWVSVGDVREFPDMLDTLRMCEELGLYVDLSIRTTAYPLRNYNEKDVEDLITLLSFCDNDNIIAYDIAWEERIGNYDGNWSPGAAQGPGSFIGRKDWDDDFTEWTKLQYGTIAAAEQAWGVKLDRTSEGYLLLTDAMLDDETGKYQKAVAAYYRFVDDIVSAGMQEKMLHMEALAPDQLISFRMSMSGSARRTASQKPSTHCFDFQSLATTMDFMEPEGYALSGNDEAALQITFANAYARYTKPDAPIVWKEYGHSVWPGNVDANFHPSESKMQLAADYYEYVMEYALNAHTSGMFCWWAVSGYRVDEGSDYGIYNPDGSDRALTKILREYAPKFIAQGERENVAEIEIEKDDFVGGIYGMFDSLKDELAAAHNSGKCVTFVNKTQDSIDEYAYADTLLNHAVADAKPTNGTYPLRYVNGMVRSFECYKESGKTYAKITVCNTKQSIWRAGTVSLVSLDTSDFDFRHTLTADVGYLENVTFTVELPDSGSLDLRFEIKGVGFGPAYSVEIP